MKLIDKLIIHFEAKSRFHLFIIFLIFGISGSCTLILSEPIIEYIRFSNLVQNVFLLFVIRIFLIFLVYQIILIIIGFLFGEFLYFYNFEKKMLKKIFKRFK